ncbi:MAG: hypothetical protein ACP5XB_17120 [Isosphaeraceae bacterium]
MDDGRSRHDHVLSRSRLQGMNVMRKKRSESREIVKSKPVRTQSEPEFVMERFGAIREMDRSFDIAYWQRQGDAAIFRAAWELVELFHRDQGKDPNELRLQRSVENFQRR